MLQPKDEKPRVKHLDGLRGLAVLLVVIHHATVDWHGLDGYDQVHRFLRYGMHGVDLFFVLSGFCLSYPILARLHAGEPYHIDVWRFARTRIRRIVPPYYAAIGFCVVLILAVQRAGLHIPRRMCQAGVIPSELVQHVLFVANARHIMLINGSFWTLPVEAHWYVVFPIVLWLAFRFRVGFAASLAAALVVPLFYSDNYDVTCFAAFLLGIVAARLSFLETPWKKATLPLGIAFLCAAPWMPHDAYVPTNLCWELGAFCLVISVDAYQFLRSAFATAPIVAVGLASYSIYLVHQPVIGLLEDDFGMNAWIAGLSALGGGALFYGLIERWFVSARLASKPESQKRTPHYNVVPSGEALV